MPRDLSGRSRSRTRSRNGKKLLDEGIISSGVAKSADRQISRRFTFYLIAELCLSVSLSLSLSDHHAVSS